MYRVIQHLFDRSVPAQRRRKGSRRPQFSFVTFSGHELEPRCLLTAVPQVSLAIPLPAFVSPALIQMQTVISPPAGVVAVLMDRAVSLTWSPPSPPMGSAITDYVVQYRVSTASDWITFPDGSSTATAAMVTGLSNGTAYVFRVAAMNGATTGAYTAASASVTPDLVGFVVPSAGVLYVRGNGGSASAATEFGLGVSLESHRAYLTELPRVTPEVRVGDVIGGQQLLFSLKTQWGGTHYAFSTGGDTASRTAFTDTNNSLRNAHAVLEKTGTHTWVLRLDDAASASIDDDDDDCIVELRIEPFVTHGAPAAPTNLVGIPGDRQVRLTWQAPASNGGGPITNYVIQSSSDGGGTWTTVNRTASTSTAAAVTGLVNGVTYVFRVAAVNSAGTGGFSINSNSVRPVAADTVPASPSGLFRDFSGRVAAG